MTKHLNFVNKASKLCQKIDKKCMSLCWRKKHFLRCWVSGFLVGAWSVGEAVQPIGSGAKVFGPAVGFYVNE